MTQRRIANSGIELGVSNLISIISLTLYHLNYRLNSLMITLVLGEDI